jgi:hypothetical protein
MARILELKVEWSAEGFRAAIWAERLVLRLWRQEMGEIRGVTPYLHTGIGGSNPRSGATRRV